MSAENARNVVISDDVDTSFDPVKGLAQSSTGSVGCGTTSQSDYTEEENRLLVRKLDWHVRLSTYSATLEITIR